MIYHCVFIADDGFCREEEREDYRVENILVFRRFKSADAVTISFECKEDIFCKSRLLKQETAFRIVDKFTALGKNIALYREAGY